MGAFLTTFSVGFPGPVVADTHNFDGCLTKRGFHGSVILSVSGCIVLDRYAAHARDVNPCQSAVVPEAVVSFLPYRWPHWFVLINLDLVGMPTSTGWKDITPNIFSMITFHLFAFGFVGIGLLQTKEAASGKVVMRGAL